VPIFNPCTTGLPYKSFRIARKGFEGIGKVVFPNGEFSTLTTRGDIWRGIAEAEDGRQAIAAAHNQAFDLIVMDVQMPEIDGLEATHQIRLSLSNSRSRQPRIVGLTASALSEERERCLEAGMDDKLSKPVRIDELKAVLQAPNTLGSADRPSPTSGSNLPVCDERQLRELLEVDDSEGFVSKVLQLFVEQAEQLASGLPELADDPAVLASGGAQTARRRRIRWRNARGLFLRNRGKHREIVTPCTRSESCR
jgi:CheY-like chemotaxis protein